VGGEVRGEIGPGLLALVGVGLGDCRSDVEYIADKLANLRVFEDESGKMNLSIIDTGGEVLAVSQFTLYGDARRGRRPGFSDAAPPEEAAALFDDVVARVAACGIAVKTGVFRADMQVELVNDGPVTILLDSRRGF